MMDNNDVISFNSALTCCQPAQTYNETIKMACVSDFENNLWFIKEVTYVRISSCSCKQCGQCGP